MVNSITITITITMVTILVPCYGCTESRHVLVTLFATTVLYTQSQFSCD